MIYALQRLHLHRITLIQLSAGSNIPPSPCRPLYYLTLTIWRSSQTETIQRAGSPFLHLDLLISPLQALHSQLTRLCMRRSGLHHTSLSSQRSSPSAAEWPFPAQQSPSSESPRLRDLKLGTSTSGTGTTLASVSGLLAPNSCIPRTSPLVIDSGPVSRTCGPW